MCIAGGACAALLTLGTGSLATASASGASGSVQHFQRAEKSMVSKSLLDSKLLCGDPSDTTESVEICERKFASEGAVWSGDVNDDGMKELVIFPGGDWSGTGGDTYFLLQRRGNQWVSLFKDPYGWFTRNAEFDILPITRQGYHDLRIAINWCVKWNGKQYEDYDTNDYHSLSPGFFDAGDWWNADIFWDIHYQGLKSFKIVPQWFSFPPEGKRSSANVILDDPQYGFKWIALFKGGVWGVQGERAFLLLPQPAYKGAEKLEFQGDWLVIYGDFPDAAPSVVARYNRRTGELRMSTNIN